MKTRQEYINQWIEIAERDLLAAQHELAREDDMISEAICFHCQQAVEKFVKAYLVFFDIPFEKIHDIGELIEMCEAKDNQISILKKEADNLTEYAVDIRYPGLYFATPTIGEAKSAFETAKKVKDYILGKI